MDLSNYDEIVNKEQEQNLFCQLQISYNAIYLLHYIKM